MKRVTLFMMLLLVIASCSKYQPKGDYQPAGTYAEAISMTTILSDSYYEYNAANGYLIQATAIFPELTATANSTGAIMAYFKQDNKWVALPYSSHGSDYSQTLNFMTAMGVVYFQLDGWSATGNPPSTELNGVEVKVVIITNAGMAKNPDLDLTDYEQVKEAFDL